MGKSLQHQWIWLIIAGFASIALGCVTIRNATPPPEPCPLEDVQIDERVLPEEWYFRTSGEPANRFGVDFEILFFNSTYGGGMYAIYRDWSAHEAKDNYDDLVNSYFSSWRDFPEWSVPPELTYQSHVADQVRIGCATQIDTDREECQFAARYDAYVVYFQARMSEVMTYANFEIVMRDVDERMSTCLE